MLETLLHLFSKLRLYIYDLFYLAVDVKPPEVSIIPMNVKPPKVPLLPNKEVKGNEKFTNYAFI